MGSKRPNAPTEEDLMLQELNGAIPASELEEMYSSDDEEGFKGTGVAEEAAAIITEEKILIEEGLTPVTNADLIKEEFGISADDDFKATTESIIPVSEEVTKVMEEVITKAKTNTQNPQTIFEEEQVMTNVPVMENQVSTPAVGPATGMYIEHNGKKYFALPETLVAGNKNLTKNEIKEMVNTTKVIENEVKDALAGKGKSEIYGAALNIVAQPAEITRVVKEVLNKNLEVLVKKFGNKINAAEAKKFIDSFQGISMSFFNNKNGMVMTIDEAVKHTRESLLAVNPNMSAAEIMATEKRAINIVSKYIGKYVPLLTHTNTTSIEVLVMRFDKNLIPKVKSGAGSKDDERLLDFLLAPITNNYFKFCENTPNIDSIGWAIDLYKLFTYIQPAYTVQELKDTVELDGVALCKDKISGVFLSTIFTFEKKLNRNRK